MAIIKASPEELRTQGRKLVSNAEQYLQEVKKLYATVDNLRAIWQGDDNQIYVSKVYSYKSNIDALGQVIGNYGVFLQETGNSLEKLNADIASQAGRL